jgi:hypothetical protein
MRLFLAASLVLALAAAPLRADDREDALAVIDRAIKAHGGADALTKAQTAVRTASGTMALFDKDVAFKDEMVWRLPDHFRLTIDVGAAQAKTRIQLVITPDKGWQSTGGMVSELGPERLEEMREEGYVLWLTTLLPLKKDPAFELASIADAKANGQPANGVKVAHKGHTDVRLLFDKETGLLVKIERRARDAGQMVDKEYVYGGHKEFDGIKLPTKIQELTNGKRFTDLTEMSYKFPSSVDDSTFGRP